MKTAETTTCDAPVSRPLAPEDLRCGDFVSILHEIIELPSYYWTCDAQILPPGELIRIQWRTADCGTPLKVKAICLPFLLVKSPCGKHRTLDCRQHRLVQLSRDYARTVWKVMSKQAAAERTPLVASAL